jgi:predicted PurR-regulated permease PerM
MLKPLYDWFMGRERIKGHTRIGTTLTLITFFLIIIIPLFIIGFLIVTQAGQLLETVTSEDFAPSLTNLVADVEDFLQNIPALGDIEIDQQQIAEALKRAATTVFGWLANLAVSLGTTIPNLFIGAIVFLIVVATLLPTFDDLEKRIQDLSPLEVNITQIYLLKGREMVSSVIKGVFLLAIIQGLMMGVFYWLAQVPFWVFWTLLSIAFAVLPVVGISFIALPMAIIHLFSGYTTEAIIVLVGFYIFVNPTDLTLRPRLISKEAYLNFTLMLLALFGGLAVGGLLGMIYGPVIMILFMTTIDIYAEHFSPNRKETEEIALTANVPEMPPETTPAETDASS